MIIRYAYTLLAAALFVPQHTCPPKLEIGQTYNDIKSGPCPDILPRAAFRADSVHVGYYCPSKNVMVVGDVTTGKMVAFFLYEPQ